MDIKKQCLFVQSADVIQLPTTDYRYAGKPYRDFGFNGVALTDASPGENYTLQLTGVFAAKLDKNVDLEDVKIGRFFAITPSDELIYIQDSLEAPRRLFGKVIANPNPVSRRVNFMLVQWHG